MSDHDGEPVQEALREQGAEQKENEERSVASSEGRRGEDSTTENTLASVLQDAEASRSKMNVKEAMKNLRTVNELYTEACAKLARLREDMEEDSGEVVAQLIVATELEDERLAQLIAMKEMRAKMSTAYRKISKMEDDASQLAAGASDNVKT